MKYFKFTMSSRASFIFDEQTTQKIISHHNQLVESKDYRGQIVGINKAHIIHYEVDLETTRAKELEANKYNLQLEERKEPIDISRFKPHFLKVDNLKEN